MVDRHQRKAREGVVVSNKMTKTVVVKVHRQVVHPKYGRTMRTSNRFAVHDEKSECNVGDVVRIMETRPLSKTKRWRVVEVVTKAK
jgi:small subunit ribosomal protein S17